MRMQWLERQVALRPDGSSQGADARFYSDWLRAAAKADAVWKLNGRAPYADERPLWHIEALGADPGDRPLWHTV